MSVQQTPFQFGYRYTHFWYTMQPQPPYRILATSAEFCLSSFQDRHDCESVQFISGMTLDAADNTSVLLSYGINDCEAKIARMSLRDVWAMMHPLEGELDACV